MRKFLIHLLGGFTLKETQESNTNSAEIGSYMTLVKIRAYAQSLNGLSADEWCKKMYNLINEEIKQYDKE